MPLHHYFVQPILIINFAVRLSQLGDNMTLAGLWEVLVAAALMALAFSARIMALTAQNRVIRLEERLRLARLMPPEEHQRIDDLALRQLVGLRFASDAEVVDLARRCLAGELPTAKAVKQNIRQWRPDYLRV
jgi:hypothetical protein